MKRWIYAAESSSVTLYHGGKLPTNYMSKESNAMRMPDLGLHVGPLPVAELHDRNFIIEVEVDLHNVVSVPDQNDWNSVGAVFNILKAANYPMSLKEINELRYEAGVDKDDWRESSVFYNNLLIDAGVSVVEYINDIDGYGTTNYCIVDKTCIKSIRSFKVPQLNLNMLDELSAKNFYKLPNWVQDITVNFRYIKGDRETSDYFYIVIKPLPGDPDQHLKMIKRYGTMRDLIHELKDYKSTFNAEIAPEEFWLTEYKR